MDTGNCLLIDSLMYIYRKYSFREKVKYVVWLKKESVKITLNFFEPNKRIDVLVVVKNPFNTPFNPTRFYPGMSQEPALKKNRDLSHFTFTWSSIVDKKRETITTRGFKRKIVAHRFEIFAQSFSRIPSVTERKHLFREQLSLSLISALLSNCSSR